MEVSRLRCTILREGVVHEARYIAGRLVRGIGGLKDGGNVLLGDIFEDGSSASTRDGNERKSY